LDSGDSDFLAGQAASDSGRWVHGQKKNKKRFSMSNFPVVPKSEPKTGLKVSGGVAKKAEFVLSPGTALCTRKDVFSRFPGGAATLDTGRGKDPAAAQTARKSFFLLVSFPAHGGDFPGGVWARGVGSWPIPVFRSVSFPTLGGLDLSFRPLGPFQFPCRAGKTKGAGAGGTFVRAGGTGFPGDVE